MRLKRWTQTQGLFVNPIGLAVVLVVLLGIGAVRLWLKQTAYVYPGPAIAVLGLAIVALLIGWVISDLQAKNRALAQQVDDIVKLGHRPRVLGLELLVKRWQEFKPQPADSVILHQQISIALSIAQLAYNDFDQIQFMKYFSGFKIRSGAFLLQPGQDSPLVLKFDSLANIEAEKERYQACVARRLGQTPGEPWEPPQHYGVLSGQPWGAITYNLIGANQVELRGLQTFTDYYLAHPPQQVTLALTHIFAALHPWWVGPSPQNECALNRRATLYGEYDRLTRHLNEMKRSIRQVGHSLGLASLQNIDAGQPYLKLDGQQRFRNPFHWVEEIFMPEQLGHWTTLNRRDSIAHGDFHTGNILISEDNYGQLRAWVIDFPLTHVGPTIQDIARLEVDLKFALLLHDTSTRLDIETLYRFEEALLPTPPHSPPSFAILTPTPLPAAQQANQALQKVWQSVCLLRSEALNYMMGDDARPYYLALLHATMPTLYYRNHNDWQKLYAFISAALLCERLSS